MSTIKAIETRYAGCRFRSRLEARWAVFFDHLGVEWEYEPEGFETSAGRYLPDFRIQLFFPFATWTWFEVKPPGAPFDPRHSAFTDAGNFLTVARGMRRSYADQYAGDPGWMVTMDPPGKYAVNPVGFYAMPAGLTTFIGPIAEGCPEVDRAYAAARSARFDR